MASTTVTFSSQQWIILNFRAILAFWSSLPITDSYERANNPVSPIVLLAPLYWIENCCQSSNQTVTRKVRRDRIRSQLILNLTLRKRERERERERIPVILASSLVVACMQEERLMCQREDSFLPQPTLAIHVALAFQALWSWASNGTLRKGDFLFVWAHHSIKHTHTRKIENHFMED